MASRSRWELRSTVASGIIHGLAISCLMPVFVLALEVGARYGWAGFFGAMAAPLLCVAAIAEYRARRREAA